MAHTAGGWNRNISPASRYPTIFAGRNTHVARVVTQGIPEEEAEANANLIAAAPKMLDALRLCLTWIESELEVDCDSPSLEAAAKAARAAIAAATGQ